MTNEIPSPIFQDYLKVMILWLITTLLTDLPLHLANQWSKTETGDQQEHAQPYHISREKSLQIKFVVYDLNIFSQNRIKLNG